MLIVWSKDVSGHFALWTTNDSVHAILVWEKYVKPYEQFLQLYNEIIQETILETISQLVIEPRKYFFLVSWSGTTP